MKQEKIDELMNEIDKNCKLPKYWNDFIEQNSEKHRLIIKDSKEKNLYCTNCKKTFVDKSIKVKDYIACPHCNKKSEVFGINFYRKSFENSIVLVQRMNKKIIIRVFEIYSYCSKDTKEIKKDCIEYARIIPGIGRFLGNNVYNSMFCGLIIYHGYEKLNWRKYTGQKFFTDNPTYPYNKKRIIKNTNMEYAPIKEFMEKYPIYNYLDVLELAAYDSFEILWNMKLYNLSFHSKSLNKNGSFYKRFGVPKNFLKFMQDNNITYRNLKILKLLKKEDYTLIQKCSTTTFNNIKFLIKNNILEEYTQVNNYISEYDIELLENLSNEIPLKKLKNYSEGLKNLIIYKDYLDMSKKLGYTYRAKADLFPENLLERHDELQIKLKITEDMDTQFAFYLRFLELSKYTYDNNKYIIFPAPTVSDLKDEGIQQGNCVGYAYLDKYIKKETEIYFIRNINDVTKSFITLEFKNGVVVQKELPHHNRNLTSEQLEFIEAWCNFRKLIDKKEKYQSKHIEKSKKYDLTKLVA